MSTKLFYILLAGVVVVCVGITLLIQAFSDTGRPHFGRPPMVMLPGQPASMVKADANGVYVLSGSKLVKYNAVSLTGKKELNLPAAGKTDPMQPPILPIAFETATSANGTKTVLVLNGNNLIVVDSATMKITRQIALPALPVPNDFPAPPPPPGGPEMGPGAPMPPGGPDGHRGPGFPGGPMGPMGPMGGPGMRGPGHPVVGFEVTGDIAYITHGPQILAVNYVTGEVTGKAQLTVLG